ALTAAKEQGKHVDFLKTSTTSDNTYCNKMMWDRVMYLKRTNTFIHSSNKDLNKVCTTDGVASGPYKYKSKNPFNITICTLRPWSIYYTGVNASKKIVISCWDGLPVFYVKSI
uniref:Ribonuclease A-domain domain-containing protein n=1 Tax=Chelydra serpentina TaxID=8475 RepID=A0A8C3XPN5_CHESE